MNISTKLLILLSILGWSAARDTFGTDFIKSYILNEQKPTLLIFSELSCWNKNEKVHLANEISKIGSRVSASLQNLLKYQDHNLLFLLDLDCPDAEKILELATLKNLFKAPYRWLILTNSTEEDKLETLWNCPMLPDSDVVLAERKDDQYIMVELHKPGRNFSTISTPRGFFNGTLVDVRPRRELFWRRMDLKGHPLTMSNVIQDSNTTKYHLPREDGENFQNDAITRVSWMNAKVAFLMLNATPRYIFSYRWGFKVNGKWSGMIDDLHSGRADIGTNCVVSFMDRLSVVSYTDTLAPFRVRFIFRQPPLSYVSNIYSLPFNYNLWIGTVAFVTVSAAAIWVTAKWELKLGMVDKEQLTGISDAVLFTMSALSQQGCDLEPKRTPGRIMQWVVFTALMALYAAYTANIVVLLQAPSNSIQTLSQLAASKITLAAYEVDYNHFFFKQFKDPVRVAINKRVDPEKGKPQFYGLNEGVERIRRGLFAFHAIDEQIYRRIEQTFQASEKCDLKEIDHTNAFDPYAPMKRDSPYLELMKVAFKRIRETGVRSGLSSRHLVLKPQCHQGSAFTSVGLIDLKPVMYLMVIGFGASGSVLLLEIAVFYMKKKMERQKKPRTFYYTS